MRNTTKQSAIILYMMLCQLPSLKYRGMLLIWLLCEEPAGGCPTVWLAAYCGQQLSQATSHHRSLFHEVPPRKQLQLASIVVVLQRHQATTVSLGLAADPPPFCCGSTMRLGTKT